MLMERDSLSILLGLIKQQSKNSSVGEGRRHTVHSVRDLDTQRTSFWGNRPRRSNWVSWSLET